MLLQLEKVWTRDHQILNRDSFAEHRNALFRKNATFTGLWVDAFPEFFGFTMSAMPRLCVQFTREKKVREAGGRTQVG